MASDAQKKLQSLSETYQKLQGDLQKAVSDRQKLEAQNQENRGVQKEFSSLDADEDIYKMVGSVLLKQDRKEAVDEVEGRLRFIADGLKQAEAQIQKVQQDSEKTKNEILQIQAQSQAQSGQVEGQAAA